MIALDMSTHLFSKLFKKVEHFVPGALGIGSYYFSSKDYILLFNYSINFLNCYF